MSRKLVYYDPTQSPALGSIVSPTSESQDMSRDWSLQTSPSISPRNAQKLSSTVEERSGIIKVSVDLNIPPVILPQFKSMREAYEALTFEEKKSYKTETIAFADAHANTIRMIYLRVLTGVLDITSTQYVALKSLYDSHAGLLKMLNQYNVPAVGAKWSSEYKKIHDAVKNNMTAFNAIVRGKEIIENGQKISVGGLPVHHHLMTVEEGDLLGDRREQDAFTLALLAYLDEQKEFPEDKLAKYIIIYSNHDEQFMLQYQKGFLAILKTRGQLGGGMRNDADRSLVHLGIALKHNVVPYEIIAAQIERAYKPYLKMGHAVSVDNKSVDRFFHAPVDAYQVKSLAEFFSVIYQEGTVENTINTIDTINEKFQRKVYCQQGEKLSDLLLPDHILNELYEFQENNPKAIFEPIFNNSSYAPRGFLWGRPNILKNDFESTKELNAATGERNFKKVAGEACRTSLCLPDKNECPGSYYHGHVGEGRGVVFSGEVKNYHNLESNLGKYPGEDVGCVRIYYCGTHQPALNLLMKFNSPEIPLRSRVTSPPPSFTLGGKMTTLENTVDTPTGGCPGFFSRSKSIRLTSDKAPERKRSFCGT